MLERFRYVTLDVTMTAEAAAHLPPYKGSTLRGAFGHAFRRVACPFRACPPCLVPKTCPYTYVFETPPRDETGWTARLPAVPHPFILEPPPGDRTVYAPDEAMTFGLVLIGRAIDFAPYFVVALREMGRAGLGRGRARWRLARITDRAAGATLYDGATDAERLLAQPTVHFPSLAPAFPSLAPAASSRSGGGEGEGEGAQVTVRFETPTRLKYDGHLNDKPEFHVLMRNLLRRLSALATCHCGFTLDVDFRDLIRRAEQVATRSADLRWVDWERYSARQDARMTLGGFVGTATFAGDLAPFTPFLRLGEVVHVGKGTAFGLGKYQLSLFPSPPPAFHPSPPPH